MSDSIQALEDVPKVVANVLPLHIQYSGPAKANEYFTASRCTEQLGDKTVDVAYFRGSRLVGQESHLGENTGYIVNASESLAHDEEGEVKTIKTYTSVAQFNQLNIFGHDSLAELDNQWSLLNEWVGISHVLHDE
ncbi:ribonuclease H1 small subunit [Suhomyces tanzawaensis NRRL Y-17324]|uniref:Ribonuclease H1 small subunit n=1 Tax=Suhomyces tanzawaensis NRRL Y-17324 TaxID=984487 RepID=A0A1E4SF18_9ASCO|nr:ribonuclease H1 small subunit [Suhomyces tanzawaensis NRRL Y-17324]ODV78129.1 ribonuclease H1 small subunit [Suhomyces tanzawaensis NRRL Y-17324]